MILFAAVGTTQFDGLVASLVAPEMLALMASQGFKRLVLQLGKGPDPAIPKDPPLKVEWYRFKPSLDADLRQADLVISHAGAGSILEALRLRKRLVVVVNDALMHNHQEELAQELHTREHLIATTPANLAEVLRESSERPAKLIPMPLADTAAFPRYLADAMGLS